MVSIIIPAYKSQYLKEMIDSILSQTYSDFELLIVNDASPNPIDEIVKSYSDLRIKYFVNKKNIGGKNLVEHWNYCLGLAKGEFVVMASDDDVYHKEFLKQLISLTKKYPNIDVFHCRVGIIDENDNPIYWSTSIAEYESDIDFIYQRAINRRPQLISDFLIRKSALDALGGFCEYPLAWYSDEMTLYKLSLGKGVACSLDSLFFWRSSSINISSMVADIEQKAEATLRYYTDMRALIDKLSPHSIMDEYLKNSLAQKYRDAAARQLIYDLAKSPLAKMVKVLKKPEVKNDLLTKKDKIRLSLLLLRRFMHI